MKQTLHCTKSAASQNRPVGQCESFMARRTESVRVNLFFPQQGETLTQSLAPRQEGSAHLETASKHEHNPTVGSHRYRKRCASYFVYVLSTEHCEIFYFGFDDKFPKALTQMYCTHIT